MTPALIGAGSSSNIAHPAALEINSYTNDDMFAAGSQKVEVNGSILKWHHQEGVLKIAAEEYIDHLEQELMTLKRQLEDMKRLQNTPDNASITSRSSQEGNIDSTSGYYSSTTNYSNANTTEATSSSGHAVHHPPGNELLEFLKTLSAEQVSELTECASPDVLEAMNALVSRMIDVHEPGNRGGGGMMNRWSKSSSECTATELAQLLYWLMMVGHQLRDLEVRSSLVASLQGTTSALGSMMGADDVIGEDGDDDDDFRRSWSAHVPRLP